MIIQEERDKLYDSLNKYIKKYSASHEVVCFGNNDITAETIRFLNQNGIPVNYIFDNAYEGKNERGINVIHPENYGFSKKTVVLIGSKYYKEMKSQLLAMGYSERQIVKTINYASVYNPVVNFSVFVKELCLLYRAKKTYKKITKNIEKDSVLFISPAKSIGDIYLLIMYTKQYVEKEKIKHFQYVITGGAAESICKACNVMNYIRVSGDAMIMICNFVRFMDIPDNKAIICNERMAYTNLGRNVIGYEKYNNFSLSYRKGILGMKEDTWNFKTPLLEYKGDIHKIFSDHKLIEGKTVLIAPYTNCLKLMSYALWIELVDKLNKKGFTVCTNCASESEEAIGGSIPINLKFNEICDFLNTAGYFIGARSGLCDVVSSSIADLHILYPDISAYEYFSLRKMKLQDKSNVKEYIWNPDETIDFMVNRIINNMQ